MKQFIINNSIDNNEELYYPHVWKVGSRTQQSKLKYFCFYTSCGNVYLTPAKFTYKWCSFNIKAGLKRAKITDEKEFVGK